MGFCIACFGFKVFGSLGLKFLDSKSAYVKIQIVLIEHVTSNMVTILFFRAWVNESSTFPEYFVFLLFEVNSLLLIPV